mgnify:CR=1 FL=1
MAVSSTSITFLGNGRTTTPYKNPRINRGPSSKGIQRTNPRTVGEFRQRLQAENGLRSPETLGRAAVRQTRPKGGLDMLA